MRQLTRAIYKKIGLNGGDLLIILGIILLSAPLLWSLRCSYLQDREDREWAAQNWTSPENTDQDAREGESPPHQADWPPAKLIIEKMDLSAVVIEGYKNSDLNRGPIHLPGSAGPGEYGNCCIAAHKEKWFRKLRTLRAGDVILLRTHTHEFIYHVTDRKIIKPSNLKALRGDETPTITLITCTGLPYGGSKKRLLVIGTLVETRKRPSKNGGTEPSREMRD